MNCLLCGHILGPTALLTGDRDFCVPGHRRQYHERLRRVLGNLEDSVGVVPPAGFIKGTAGELCLAEGLRVTRPAEWFGPGLRLPGIGLAVVADAEEPVAEPAPVPVPTPKVTIRSRRVRELLQMDSVAVG